MEMAIVLVVSFFISSVITLKMLPYAKEYMNASMEIESWKYKK